MRQNHRCNQRRLSLLSGKAQINAAGTAAIVVSIQNELLLEFRQVHWLTDLSTLWEFSVRLNKRLNLCDTGH